VKQSMNPGAMKTIKMENPATDGPFLEPPRAHGAASVEPEELSRFEGEGGHEAPDPEWIDVPLEHGTWRKQCRAAGQIRPANQVLQTVTKRNKYE